MLIITISIREPTQYQRMYEGDVRIEYSRNNNCTKLERKTGDKIINSLRQIASPGGVCKIERLTETKRK